MRGQDMDKEGDLRFVHDCPEQTQDPPAPRSLAGLSPERAADLLYRLYARDLRRLARSLVHASEVDDVVSEAFTSVLQALRNGSGPTDDRRGYLVVTMRRSAILFRSRRARYPAVPLDEERLAATPALTDDGDADVIGALASLPPRHQAVLWATAVQGYKPREIATQFQINRQATAALAYRARRSFRDAILEQVAQ